MSIQLSIVVPVFNEADAIERSVDILLRQVEKRPRGDVEIIIVDDGSTDGTGELLKNNNAPEFLNVVTHKRNRGYGASIKTGVTCSDATFIAITDADDTYPNDRIIEFFEKTISDDLDMLVGARVGDNVHIPILRRFPKWLLNRLSSFLAERKIPDVNSGMRIIRRDVFEKYRFLLPDGFSLTTTITLAMLTNGYDVEYRKIDYAHRIGSSKIRPIYDTLNFLGLIFKTILWFRPLKIFMPAFFALFFSGVGLFVYRIASGGGFAVSSMMLILASIQILATGLIAELFDKRFLSK